MPNKEVKSQYYQPENSVALLKLRLLQHLELMRIPVQLEGHNNGCTECHGIERNQTLDAIKFFLTNVPSVEK